MKVAKGVDEQDVDVGRQEQEVLDERREHVPRVHVKDGGYEVQAVCRLDESARCRFL